jgi:two-component system, sensor histidine kinase
LINSKKYYVRHISHELRTPLNTAFLGLRLLSNELKESKDPKDIERYETLRDVNLSCTAAVDILNDLLCYEKLQSGMLDLHKEHVTVDLLLRECVSMFSVQARDCGVDINLTCAGGGGEGGKGGGMGEGEIDTGRGGDSTQQSLPVPVPVQPFDTIFVDKFKINQVIRNLISNALKFTPRGGRVSITARIILDTINIAETHLDASLRKVSFTGLHLNPLPRQNSGTETLELNRSTDSTSRACTGRLIVVVSDTGAGISKENQSRLFKEIIQFSPEKLQAGGGSGLGLWITKGIVDLHDGNISVFSEGESMGSSFTVEMPMACWPAVRPESGSEVLHVPSAETASVAESLSASAKGDKALLSVTPCLLGRGPSTVEPLPQFHLDPAPPILHVLVVDDSPLNRKMLLKCLRSEGHICLEAVDGLDAVTAVKKRIDYTNGGLGAPFDVILMDFVMPNMDGPTATKEIRALGYTAPIFGVTGNGKHQLS